jgi:hypothetical protein
MKASGQNAEDGKTDQRPDNFAADSNRLFEVSLNSSRGKPFAHPFPCD